MTPESPIHHGPVYVRGFRQRGHGGVSRIEGFSDAVFGFSVTLLVVSQRAPATFGELSASLAALPAFAFSYALIAQIWFVQNRFFRRYGLHDAYTVFLNIVMLFVVIVFTYPLKFLFTIWLTGSQIPDSVIRDDQIAPLFTIYAVGYGSIFLLFVLMHVHVLRLSRHLALTSLERHDTYASIALGGFQVCVAVVSFALATTQQAAGNYQAAAQGGGAAYLLVPVGLLVTNAVARRARARLAALATTPD